MKLTAENFFELLNDKNITCSVQGECLFLNGTDSELIKKLYELIDKSPKFEAGIIRHIHMKHGMSLKEYQLALESAGVRIKLAGLYTLQFIGGKDKTRERLIGILERNSYLKAAVILSQAVNDSDLFDMIKERACIRWAEGYSDSLLMAVLSGITLTGETIKRDTNGQIILKPKTDWTAEISNL